MRNDRFAGKLLDMLHIANHKVIIPMFGGVR